MIVKCMVFAAYVKPFSATGDDFPVRLNDNSVKIFDAAPDISTHRVAAT